jgi:hypothetical protein
LTFAVFLASCPKIKSIRRTVYPILAAIFERKNRGIFDLSGRTGECLAIEHILSVFMYGTLTLVFDVGIVIGPDGGQIRAGTGSTLMGAAPLWDSQPENSTPLTEQRTYTEITEIVPAKTAKPGPRRYFARVPTHAIGMASERRRYPRAALSLPLKLTKINGVPEQLPILLVTRNISSSGIYFFAPRLIAAGTSVELQVGLVERASGCGSVQMLTAAHIIRSEKCDMPGWHGYAASFDDFALQRDDVVPLQYGVA